MELVVAGAAPDDVCSGTAVNGVGSGATRDRERLVLVREIVAAAGLAGDDDILDIHKPAVHVGTYRTSELHGVSACAAVDQRIAILGDQRVVAVAAIQADAREDSAAQRVVAGVGQTTSQRAAIKRLDVRVSLQVVRFTRTVFGCCHVILL